MIAAKDRANWLWGGGIALVAHVTVFGAVALIGNGPSKTVIEEPVVLVELPPEAAPPAASASPNQPLKSLEPDQSPVSAPALGPRLVIEAPQVRAPLPREFVTAPLRIDPQATQRIAVAAPPSAALPSTQSQQTVAPSPAGSGAVDSKGDDPQAKRDEANYYAQLSAHLNRKKRYPGEAKKARQQGVVTVRFTVHSDGRISDATIRKSSGHDLLDQATLELMGRVAPLPRFPKSMTRASVTISLPIDYSLRTQ